jgi:uncharacterized metal-binding protein
MDLAFLWSPWLLLHRDRNLFGFIGHDVIDGQFHNLNNLGFVLAAPIVLVLVLLLGAISADAHDLLIPEESAVSTIRMLFSHSIPLLLLG